MAEEVARGYEAIGGLGLESVVGTPVVATQRIAMISESLSAPFDEIADASLAGTPSPRPAANGSQRPQGSYLANLEYVAGHMALAHFFGQYNSGNLPPDYTFLKTLRGQALTLPLDKRIPVGEVWQFAGVKFSQLVISGTPTDGVRYSPTILGTGQTFEDTLNSPAILDALPKAGERILYHHVTFTADSDLTVAPATEYNPGDFTLTSNRQMDAPSVNRIAPLEALENGYRDTVLTLTFPRYTETLHQFISWMNAGTLFQWRLRFTDGSSFLHIEAPVCKVRSALPNIGGPELPPLGVEVVCYNNKDGQNTYLPDVEDELYVSEPTA